MLVMTLLVNVEVGFRFLLNLPLDAISEIVLLFFPWLSLMGAAVAVNTEGANVALHLFRGRLSERSRTVFRAFVHLATLGFGIFLIVQGLNYSEMTLGELSNVLSISRSWEIAAFPVSGLFIVAYSAWGMWKLFRPSPLEPR